MAVLITGVDKGGAAEGHASAGETLVAINGMEIEDVLDYMYQSANKKIELTIRGKDGERKEKIKKEEYEDLGLQFATYLMDKQRHCSNKCIFCFIDQLPKGMRETLYFKDDDARMSFLMGNYITLTNLSEKDIQKIIHLKISPINISVQTTNPELRVFMMKNPNAANGFAIMRRFADANIEMNCQVVVCKGVNDGAELDKTLNDLISLYPKVNSISVVPVGITKYRDGLYPLKMIEKDDAVKIIEQVEKIAGNAKKTHDSRIVFLADEFFLRAKMPIPEPEYYEDYPQIENGVGLMASMKEEFDMLIRDLPQVMHKRKVTMLTGVASYPFIKSLLDELKKKCHTLSGTVYAVENEFFGKTVDVSGLVVGRDLIKCLETADLGDEILIPAQMLRYDRERFLDDVTVKEIEERFKRPVRPIENTGEAFISAVLDIEL
ncbi:MAG: DUF512 domain-containing protein [Bacillota bacterium]|nr:DUF512 domain-containing protein [Bacillota bacterium]